MKPSARIISCIYCLLFCSALTGIQTASALSVPGFCQKDPNWASKHLDGSGYTMGDSGCAVTSVAMVLRYYQADVDPGRLCDWGNANSMLDGGGNINWARAADYPGGNKEWGGRTDWTYVAADLQYLRDLVDQGYPPIVEVRWRQNDDPYYRHFVVITGYSGDTFYINDPIDGAANISLNVRYGYGNLARWVYGCRLYCGSPGGPPPPVVTTVVSESDAAASEGTAGFWRHGTASYWKDASIGDGGHMLYVKNNDPAHGIDNMGDWRPNLPQDGNYEVFVYVPSNYATTREARYEVYHADGRTDVTISQYSYSDAWVSLGTFRFSAGSGNFLRLADMTNEGYISKYIGYDTAKWEFRAPPPPPPTVSTPTFNPDGGTYTSARSVTISCATDGAAIHYTTNGNDPTEGDPTIGSGGSVSVDRSMIFKARAWRSGWNASGIKSAAYTITGTVVTPAFSPDGGLYSSSQAVAIICATPDAAIHYTTNGNDPTESDPVIASGSTVTVDRSMTLKARAWKADWDPSALKSSAYTITPTITTTLTMDLQSGWNMVSIPLVPAGGAWGDWTSALGGITPLRVYAWDVPSGTYVNSSSPVPGCGYWVRMANSARATIEGISSGTTISLDLQGDSSGRWNLIGNPFAAPLAWDVDQIQVSVSGGQSESLRQAVADGWISDHGWCWGGIGYTLVCDPQIYDIPGSIASLEPTDGCWLRAFRNCQLILNAD